MSEDLKISSNSGSYFVRFNEYALNILNENVPKNAHFIIDHRVADLYKNKMPAVLDFPSVLLVEPTEKQKSLDKFPNYVQHMVESRIRRDHVLIGIGGGIIQDITCFLAATLLSCLLYTSPSPRD